MRRSISVRLRHQTRHATVLIVFWLAIFCAGAPAKSYGSAYENSTRETIQKLIRANDLLMAGHTAESRALMQEMGQSIRALDGIAQQYREFANREHALCTARIADLDVKTNELFVEQTELNRQIDDLKASLVGAAAKRDLAAAEIKRLNEMLSNTIRSMKEREAKLKEIEKWWWVPGYGQYLAIRTLVDDDIGRYNGTITALRDQQQRLAANAHTLGEAQALITTLTSRQEQAERLNRQLVEMRASAQTNLRGLNGIAVFLTEADVFWGLAQNLLQVDAESYVRKMKIIQDVLAREDKSPSLTDPSVSMAQNFQQKLVEFADSVDKESNFLLKDTSEFCGGPLPRPHTNDAISSPISRRCNIDQITAYYEIVDPNTCSFRYLNPPGCPPLARTVSTRADAISHGRARGTWIRATGQNWVGRPSTSPCSTAGTIYYGKLSGPEQCESACMSDADCTIWTFNTNNGFMPDSINQCWGGSASLDPNKTAWAGFISGGIR